MSSSETDELLQEVLSGIEASPPTPLSPLVRKASRLADLAGELEYRLLFDLHLSGVSRDAVDTSPHDPWPDPQIQPRWDPIKTVLQDRTVPGLGVQHLSLEQIEAQLEQTRSLRERLDLGTHQGARALEHAIEGEQNLLSILGRVRTRVGMFCRNLQRSSVLPGSVGEEQPSDAGRRIFLGHGRSEEWRAVADFLQSRLHLAYDEFNREPTAGYTVKERLEQMLADAGMALLLLTGEDLHEDGTWHARENVIHEVGLFQGRLGFRRAIVLLEDGCREFSNIAGLIQLRFPKGQVRAIFEDVRLVLEREGLIDA